jgi:predicted AlkP superfamily pyrophosphatase or phosphodiesterase
MKTPPLVVINIVGLTPDLLGEHTPQLNSLASDGFMAPMSGVFPAVTCTAQATMLTGKLPRDHGIVANGWYFRDLAEVMFWRQSNHLVQAEQVWDTLRRHYAGFSCAQLFWWFNMYARVDFSVTPRPIYPADGRKLPGLYSAPADLQGKLQATLGSFPLFNFWGPASDIRSSQWIADAAREVFRVHRPGLQFVYLPHLDYNLQRLGPRHPDIGADVAAIDAVAGGLVEDLRGEGAEIIVVSEYGVEAATGHVDINRRLREHDYLAVRKTLDWELLDAGASRAFAVADHQVAHVYVRDPADLAEVAVLLQRTPGIERVLGKEEKVAWGLDHERSGELVAVAEPGHWFTYYYWLDDAQAPDFARTVDIHRKPGYDPVELFLDPDLRLPRARIAWRLLQKKLGLRVLMDVIPLQPHLVKGTHGRCAAAPGQGPLFISTKRAFAREQVKMQEVKELICQHWNNY